MEQKEFSIEIIEKAKKIGISITPEMVEQFYQYMNLLIEWNGKMNLTAIVNPKDIILKHFIDSITINKYLKDVTNFMDIGTGAGFPGVPLKVLRPEIEITLVDSLNKRILFLENICQELKLAKIECLHARAEELARNSEYREQYDIVTSRAVAALPTLLEYMLPFVKVGGRCICMKGPCIEEELEKANRAIQVLGGKVKEVEKFVLPDTDIERNIIIIEKIDKTANMYPRKAGIPSKQPIV